MKVATIVGTRPEIIRLACTIKKLDRSVSHVLIHTGQNYDYELNEIFFRDLGLKAPDRFLEIAQSSLGKTLGQLMEKTETALVEERPDAVLILGDTNSALSAIIAKRLRIPVYHMEAGNRCFDFNVPEELNRRIVDHIADFNLVYTEHARRHLLAEGFPHRRIVLTGSPMREVLEAHSEGIASSTVLTELGLKPGSYALVSAHREENVDLKDNLAAIVAVMRGIRDTFNVEVIVSTHPRTAKRLQAAGFDAASEPGIRFLKPFGFFDYNRLQKDSFVSVSDSGTISEESAILNFPAITIRNAIERPEALDTGSIALTGLDIASVIGSIKLMRAEFEANGGVTCPADYMITNTSERVVKLIVGTAKLSRRWMGLDSGWFDPS
jgi:UDP-N-acetyl-L-fucosamine synthase